MKLQRRQFLSLAAAGISLPLDARAQSLRTDAGGQPLNVPPLRPKPRVVVVGGGMAGATVAKYLRWWGDSVDVTLVNRSSTCATCILSSEVLVGQRGASDL